MCIIIVIGLGNVGVFINRQVSPHASAFGGHASSFNIAPLEDWQAPVPHNDAEHSHLRDHRRPTLRAPRRTGAGTGGGLLLPLWRHLVDCPAGSSALCDTSVYEPASAAWDPESTDACPVAATAGAGFPSSSGEAIREARLLLRDRVNGGAGPAASALTGYAVRGSAVERGAWRAAWPAQAGCGGPDADAGLEMQLDAVVAKWRTSGKKTGGGLSGAVDGDGTSGGSAVATVVPIGFTMTDGLYAGLIEEQLWAARHVAKLRHFFVVAYDRLSWAHACGLGADVVTPVDLDHRDNDAPGGASSAAAAAFASAAASVGMGGGAKLAEPQRNHLRERTTLSKFLVAQGLARRGASFIFWEMDVFLLRRPEALLRALADPTVDVVVSAHQYSPLEPNIGVFGARGTPAAAMVSSERGVRDGFLCVRAKLTASSSDVHVS